MSFFIAEVSSNHDQDLDRSLEFINIAASIGCDAIKFQLFKIDELFSSEALRYKPELLDRKRWELPLEFIPKLYSHSKKLGIQFGCTPFYLDAVLELEPFVDFYKIASYELLWDDLLRECAKTKKKIILSTGMATMSEIKHAVKVLQDFKCKSIILLHCTSSYPTPYQEANLAAIETIAKETLLDIGWSDHTREPAVIHRAIHKWNAKVVEFHLDLDEKGSEYKTGHCWLPSQIGPVIKDIKKGFISDGSGIKSPVNSELKDRMWRADPLDGLRPLKEIRKNLENN